ncbi:transketolase family protein [Candidatus Woesearchaeota archaeon]|nr:MAG: transketolase family protein [Candidatus Woesearchaeota archaeon]
MRLNPNLFTENEEKESTRAGFGKGILKAGKQNKNVVAITADLAGSTKLSAFIKEFPDRFIQVGVAEQNLATVASGLAHVGKIPFITSFAMFSPGRNWEQIRTTICYNNQNVKIVGSHAGIGVGPDGATHQALEDIAITRVMPNIQVIAPCDAIQAEKATIAIAKTKKPAYLRVNRQKSPIITTKSTEFKIGKAQLFKDGSDVAIISCGPIIYEALLAAKELEKKGISALVLNVHTIKPIDKKEIIKAAKKTKAVVTVEDHQIHGGLGSAVAEVLAQNYPTRMEFIGIKDRFGESGSDKELYKKFGLTYKHIIKAVKKVII